jgi:hypothetical protein
LRRQFLFKHPNWNAKAEPAVPKSPVYTMRRTNLSDNPNDYVFCYEGIASGRCALRQFTGTREAWHWTIYIGQHVSRAVEGVSIEGMADTLEQAKSVFRDSFEKLKAAGVVEIP